MKTSTKIGLILSLTGLGLVIAYFITPYKAWKKYQTEHPSLFEVKDDKTPTYLNFCKSYWKTFGIIDTPKEEDMTFTGGEIDVVVKPNGTTVTSSDSTSYNYSHTPCKKPITA